MSPEINKYLCDKMVDDPEGKGVPCFHEATGATIAIQFSLREDGRRSAIAVERRFCGAYHANYWLSRFRVREDSALHDLANQDDGSYDSSIITDGELELDGTVTPHVLAHP